VSAPARREDPQPHPHGGAGREETSGTSCPSITSTWRRSTARRCWRHTCRPRRRPVIPPAPCIPRASGPRSTCGNT
jgi:hypothetical protein